MFCYLVFIFHLLSSILFFPVHSCSVPIIIVSSFSLFFCSPAPVPECGVINVLLWGTVIVGGACTYRDHTYIVTVCTVVVDRVSSMRY